LTGQQGCSSCRRHNDAAAKFCRHCGASLVHAELPAPSDGSSADAGVSVTRTPSEPPLDEQRLFWELCWLCGVPIVIAVAISVTVRVGGPSALVAFCATWAVGLVAVLGALANTRLVRAALRVPSARDVLSTLVVALVTAPTLLFAFWLLEQLGFQLSYDYFFPYVADGWPHWMGYVDVAILTPIFEELLFRGVLQPKLARVLRPTEALVVQAALFSALHLSPVIFLTHFAMGLAFGWLRWRSQSLLPGIVLHGAWNAWVLWSSP
jgi:uncharacterized protein